MIISKFTIDKDVINNEITVINNLLAQQRHFKKVLLLYLEKISDILCNNTDIIDTNSLVLCLNSIKKNYKNIKNNINELNNLKLYLEKLLDLNTFEPLYFEKYNDNFLKLFKKISSDNIFFYSFIESLLKHMQIIIPQKNLDTITLKPLLNTNSNNTNSENNENGKNITNISETSDTIAIDKKKKYSLQDISSVVKIQNQTFLENTLLICEKQGIAILPYSILELEEDFSNNPEKYSSIQDIINKEYTIYLKNYKNVANIRFREIFNLAKNKCDFNFFKSFNLAYELFFNSHLNPVIISACKSIDELNTYLDCLENNIVDKFKCFNILYTTKEVLL